MYGLAGGFTLHMYIRLQGKVSNVQHTGLDYYEKCKTWNNSCWKQRSSPKTSTTIPSFMIIKIWTVVRSIREKEHHLTY